MSRLDNPQSRRTPNPAGSSAINGLNIVLGMITSGAEATSVLPMISNWVNQEIGSCLSAIYLVDRFGRLTAAIPSTQQGMPESLFRAIDGLKIPPDRLITVTNLTRDPHWKETTEIGIRCGLQSCWSFPATNTIGDLIGVVLLWYRNSDSLTPAHESIAQTAAHVSAIALQQSQHAETRTKRVQTMMDHMIDGVIAVDKRMTVTVLNPATLRLLGLDFNPIGHKLVDAGFPVALVNALTNCTKGTDQEPRLIVAVGAVQIEAIVSPLTTALNRPYGAVAVLHDITVEATYRHLQESFVANVSHELRAPLSVVSAIMEALRDEVVPVAERSRYMDAALGEVDRMRRLATQLLELSRLDAGIIEIPPTDVDLAVLVSKIKDLWMERCRSSGITLTAECGHFRVRARSEQVEEILTNLLDNAVRFTPPGGEIHISAARLSDQQKVCIAVSDTGAGIQKEIIPYVWERFYMGDQARSRKHVKGSGLGLSIIRLMVKELGGETAVESEPGKGSRFSFTLPASAG